MNKIATRQGTAAERLTDLLKHVKPTGENKWIALCPAHDDGSPSLSVTAVPGRALVYCHAGCDSHDIVSAVGLTMSDLFDSPRELEYRYDNGRTARRSYDDGGKKTFRQSGTSKAPELYQLSRVRQTVAAGDPVLVCEGEEDVRAASFYGITATTAPQGAGNWAKVDYSPLIGADVLVIVDNDDAGMKRGRELVPHLKEIGARAVHAFKSAHGNDLADHVAAGAALGDLLPVDYTPDAPTANSQSQELETVRLELANAPTGYTARLYEDITALLERGPVSPPEPEIGQRSDGVGTVYAGHANCVLGPPESGKTWYAQSTAVEVLFLGGSVLMIDLDHNGVDATVARFQAFGVHPDVLGDPQRFRYCEPGDSVEIDGIVKDSETWRPTLTVIDSFGELGPLYGASSNSADDFTNVFRRAVKPFALHGSCVVVIDHEAKSKDSAAYGATGTSAKKRAYSGTMLRFRIDKPFSPGSGGEAEVTLVKDRNGGLRKHLAPDKEPLVGKFRMTDKEGALNAYIVAAQAGEQPSLNGSATGANLSGLVAQLDTLDPKPTSVRDVCLRMGWGKDKGGSALKAWRETKGLDADGMPI